MDAQTETTKEPDGKAKRSHKKKPNGAAPTESVKRSLDKAIEAAKSCLEEQWARFENAVHETDCNQPVSITVAVKFKPGKEGKKISRPPTVRVESKASLPSLRRVFEARDSGGQIVLDLGIDE